MCELVVPSLFLRHEGSNVFQHFHFKNRPERQETITFWVIMIKNDEVLWKKKGIIF